MEELNKDITVNVTVDKPEVPTRVLTERDSIMSRPNVTVGKPEMPTHNERNYAFGKMNFILMAVSMVIVIVGFILMSGSNSDETTFNADIFSTMRIKVAPVVCFVGFVSMIYAIVYKSDDKKEEKA